MKYERHFPKEISWLSFNERVLQEANDPSVPLIERIKFMGIFSSNLDEFYRVRVASVRRLATMGKSGEKLFHHDPRMVLDDMLEIILKRSAEFNDIYKKILKELKNENIYIVDETQLSVKQQDYVKEYFHTKVRPVLIPIMFTKLKSFPELTDKMIYLVVSLGYSKNKIDDYALIEVPTDHLSRFLLLPSEGNKNHIILLDDVIRYNLPYIFRMFKYTHFDAYTIKLTRDAELEINDDFSETYIRKISMSIKRRASGQPVRFVYDATMPKDMLNVLVKKLNISKEDTPVPGSRYHNFKDFIGFPHVGPKKLTLTKRPPIEHPAVNLKKSYWQMLKEQEILLHFPYHSYDYFIDFLRDAALDPAVDSIQISLYRVAKRSKVVNALINAIRNGKLVVVVIELQARFDEAANIYWADYLKERGAKIIFGVPDLKVHSKVCLVTRRERRRTVHYAAIGTGNFNEDTARLYTDHLLLTADPKLTREVNRLFEFFDKNYKITRFNHLIVSPLDVRRKFYKLINTEIENAKAGKESYIKLKINNFADEALAEKLYEAGQAGVKIQLIVRSMFSLIPAVSGMSENIEAVSIVDKYLEHTRILIFCNESDPKVFIGSADWMTRNIDRRIEVTTPIYDANLKKELHDYFDIQWQDNVKARIWDIAMNNKYRNGGKQKIRAQDKIYDYLGTVAKKRQK